MKINNVYQLHLQLLDVYEKNQISPSPYCKEINYYHRQLNFFCENTMQRIFVLNQLIKIHEKSRNLQIQRCSDEYYSSH
ncbi:hypothetical protein [Paenibacillus ottowii]